jgi:tetratricopeptide (TPR) repeat protein
MSRTATLPDLCHSVWQPLVTLDVRPSPHASLTARAVTHWLSCEAFDDWGASMGLIASTRPMLEAGGLELECGSAVRLDGDHPVRDELRAALGGEAPQGERGLYLARLLIILGFPGEAKQLLRTLPATTPRLSLGTLWLTTLADSLLAPGTWTAGPLAEAAVARPLEGRLGFHVALMLAAHRTQRDDLADAARWFDRAEQVVTWKGAERALAAARIARHRAMLHLAGGDERRHDAALDEALGLLERNDPGYLELELERRIREYRGWRALGAQHATRANRDVTRLETIDPTCARVWLLAAECAIASGQQDRAVAALERVCAYGVIERPYARFLWSRLTRHALLVRTTLVDAVQEDFYRAPETLAAALRHARDLPELPAPVTADLGAWLQSIGAVESSAMPLRPLTFEAAAHLEQSAATAGPGTALKRSEIHGRFTSFWTLDEPLAPTCLSAYTPVLAWWALERNPSPSFETVYLQRVTQPEFREELYRAALHVPADLERELPEAYSLEALRGHSPRADRLLDLLAEPGKDLMLRIRLSRVVAGLGFVRAGRELLDPTPDPTKPWSIDETYAALNSYFFGRVIDYRYGTEHASDLDLFFSKLPDTEETLRFRLLICLHGTVNQGQVGNAPEVERWRNTGLSVLAKIDRCSRFTDFERQLLVSRFYRAASYYPFVMQDMAMLRNDARLCEDNARALRPQNRLQQLVCDENTFPMLESMAKVHAKLGDHDRAFALVREISHSLDPLDSRAWIQLGELHEKRGETEAALDAFLRSAAIGAPFGRVAWYKAGACFEEAGDDREARRCYLRSLHHGPRGASPLDGLRRIAERTSDAHLADWVDAAYVTAEQLPGLAR